MTCGARMRIGGVHRSRGRLGVIRSAKGEKQAGIMTCSFVWSLSTGDSRGTWV